MKMLYDDNMPFAQQCFASLGDAKSFSAGTLTPAELSDIDALLVRSTTKVDADLLSKAPRLSFAATATAGFNHLDRNALELNGVNWSAAPGCNAVAVAEYVISALMRYHCDLKDGITSLRNSKVGIVGAGNVGSALAQKLAALGIDFCLCDPPLQHAGDKRKLVDMQVISECDAICLHVPYITEGPFPTQNLIDDTFFEQLSPRQLVINACRGGVLDESAYLERKAAGLAPTLILDAWSQEPDCNLGLLEHVMFGTAHIAGHSLEGKSRGTFMVYEALCAHIDQVPELKMSDFIFPLSDIELSTKQVCDDRLISRMIFSIYDISEDDRIFRQAMAQSESVARSFGYLRKHYRQRREFAAQTLIVDPSIANHPNLTVLSDLGFKVQIKQP